MYYITYIAASNEAAKTQLSFDDLFNPDGTLKTLENVPVYDRDVTYTHRTIKTTAIRPEYLEYINRKNTVFNARFATRLASYRGQDMQQHLQVYIIVSPTIW